MVRPLNYLMSFIDLSHTFTSKMPVYPGDDAPKLEQLAHVDQHGYAHFHIETGMHVGTHIDAPSHFIEAGRHLSELSIEAFTGRGVCLDARGHDTIDLDLLEGVEIPKGAIVLVRTDHSDKFRDEDYYTDFPMLTEAFAEKMVACGVKIVGLDTPSPDDEPFAVHKILLGSEVLIIENMTNLQALEGVGDFEVFAFPIKFEAEGAPLRVVARIL